MVLFKVVFLSFVALVRATPCPDLPTTYYELAGTFSTWTGQTTIDGGLQFQDINGDGLAEMLYAYGNDPSDFSFSCVYLNTGYAWVLQNTTATRSCSSSSTLLVRGTEILFRQHSVLQFRQAVADEFGLRVDDVEVRSRLGARQGRSTPMAFLMPHGFELSIRGAKLREVYSCP